MLPFGLDVETLTVLFAAGVKATLGIVIVSVPAEGRFPDQGYVIVVPPFIE